MAGLTTLSISALAALLPAALLPYRRGAARDIAFWLLLAVAVAGPLVLVWYEFAPGWRTGLASALWITVAASLVLYAILSAAMREAWRLSPLLLPYLFVVGCLATVWLHQPGRTVLVEGPSAWVRFHIAVSVVTYAFLTIGAIAGFAVVLQERALKNKRPTALTRMLPSVADAEYIQVRLLVAGAIVLGCDLLSGVGAQYVVSGDYIEFNHKVAFSFLTFAVIVALLLAHALTGMRGRRIARLVLVAYLFMTLAYPGVKFVTDVVLT